MSLVRFAAQLALGIVVTAWVLRHDLRRLPPRQLARSWNDASRWAAIVAFGPLCLPFHFVKTRRNLRGVALAVAWTALAMVALSLADAAVVALAP